MFFKRNKSSEPKASESISELKQAESNNLESTAEVASGSVSLFQRFKRGLSRTSTQLTEGIGSLVLGKKEIDDECIDVRILFANVIVTDDRAYRARAAVSATKHCGLPSLC